MKQKIIPIVSVVIGIIAFLLTSQYLRGERKKLAELEQKIYEGARKINVMVAKNDIPSGTVIRPADLRTLEVFKTRVGDLAVLPEEAEMLFGRKSLFTIKTREPILWSHIQGGARAGLGLASIVKPGMRAISLSVGGAAAVSSMIEPNDRIDVLGTFAFPSKSVAGEMETVTLTVLQDVTVLATGQRLAKQALSGRRRGRPTSYSTITLEVTPREAELLVFAQQMKGRLSLSLRNPTDVSFESDMPEINFEYLEEKLDELNLIRQRTIRHKRDL